MKKFICGKTYDILDPTKIWRGDKELKIENEKSYVGSEEKEWTTSQKLEYTYNDPKKYIMGNKDSAENFPFDSKILEEFPEYLARWNVIITNTGLVCFHTSTQGDNNFVIYDMFGKDDIHSISEDIKPDISMLLEYNMFDQPVNVRKVHFTNNEFTPERSYVYNNNWCGFFNCDGVNGNTTLNKNSFFSDYPETSDISFQEEKTYYEYQEGRYINTSDTSFQEEKTYYEYTAISVQIKNIQFNYKPLFVFKLYDSDGSLKVDSDGVTDDKKIKINVNNLTAKKYEDGIYFIDLSSLNPEENGLISISLENCDDGYLEVI